MQTKWIFFVFLCRIIFYVFRSAPLPPVQFLSLGPAYSPKPTPRPVPAARTNTDESQHANNRMCWFSVFLFSFLFLSYTLVFVFISRQLCCNLLFSFPEVCIRLVYVCHWCDVQHWVMCTSSWTWSIRTWMDWKMWAWQVIFYHVIVMFFSESNRIVFFCDCETWKLINGYLLSELTVQYVWHYITSSSSCV